MARARVQLNEGVSYAVGDMKWMRGQPMVLTNEKEIERYARNSRFSVTMLHDGPAVPPPLPMRVMEDENDFEVEIEDSLPPPLPKKQKAKAPSSSKGSGNLAKA